MFLRPHHFQASDRHWAEQAAVRHLASEPCGYGIVKLSIDPAALANRQIQLSACRAVMKDGTLVWLELGQEPDRVGIERAVGTFTKLHAALDDALAAEDTVRIYLAIPRLTAAANVSQSPGDKVRYSATRESLQDDTSGGNDQDVEFRRLNVRLLVSNQDLSGFDLLPVAQVRRTGNREAAPEIDPDYFPPMLEIEAWDPLGRGLVRSIYDLLGRKLEMLSEQAVSRQVGFSSNEPGDLDRLVMLSHVLEAHAALRTIAFAPGVHPRVAYTELCRVAGRLAIFSPQRRMPTPLEGMPAELPLYNHDDLAGIFRDVSARIEYLLNVIQDLKYEQRYFQGIGPASLGVTLEPKWLQADWRWYVGVLRGEIPEEECRSLLSGNTQLDWKLGSARQVDHLFRMGVPGLQLQPLDRPPRALPDKGGWLYYQVGRENVAWNDVRDSQSLAIRLRETLLLNRDALVGKRRIEVSHRGNPAMLEFALFAVPQTT
jgi:type VI secretion system protein ImpJ